MMLAAAAFLRSPKLLEEKPMFKRVLNNHWKGSEQTKLYYKLLIQDCSRILIADTMIHGYALRGRLMEGGADWSCAWAGA